MTRSGRLVLVAACTLAACAVPAGVLLVRSGGASARPTVPRQSTPVPSPSSCDLYDWRLISLAGALSVVAGTCAGTWTSMEAGATSG